ncbi:MAG: hydrogen gas-evolving membrane-bound hydrogenase subunit E [Pseudomonadota bacterium]
MSQITHETPEAITSRSAVRGNGLIGVVPIVIAAGLFAFFLQLTPPIADGQRLIWTATWIPSLGVELSFLVDGLSLTFALLISGIGALVLLYSNTYLAGHPQYGRFALLLSAFMVSMLGLVLANDLILLFVFWELTTFTSYLLIGFGHEKEGNRRNALQALLLTAAGGLAFLLGLILLGSAAGSSRISDILALGPELKEHALYLPIFVLLLIGAITKSAQTPFHFWLPNAMAAPTPVSAFLHSATMVKAGVYLLARIHPAMAGTAEWMWSLTILGATTAVFASFLAMRQSDLKQALAYTTLMALGTLTLFLGQESGYAITAFATFLIVHSLYKASLFLVVGNIDQSTGTRDAATLGGLRVAMPLTAAAAAVAAMSMAGFPPLLGFIGKELKYAGALAVASEPILVAGAVLVANALMLAVAGVVAYNPFWRPGAATPKAPREASWPMLAGPMILATLGALLGVYPDILQAALVHPTVLAVTGGDVEPKPLELWAGFNLPLLMSVATFALGAVFYAFRDRLRAWMDVAFAPLPKLDAAWDRLLDGLKLLAAWQTRRIQTGRLTDYLGATFVVIAAGLLGSYFYVGAPAITADLGAATWKHLALASLLISGAVLTVLAPTRITAIAGLGVVGIGAALVFIVFGAPDVAITQLLVETLVVVLVAVVMLRLPRLRAEPFRAGRALLAAIVGAAYAGVMLLILSQPLDRRLTDFFEAASVPEAYGRNIVNVILVDFRALDTFGEIAVVVVAALSAYALLRLAQGVAR